jgi:hypothetical protein
VRKKWRRSCNVFNKILNIASCSFMCLYDPRETIVKSFYCMVPYWVVAQFLEKE